MQIGVFWLATLMAISYSIPPRKKRDLEKMERSHVIHIFLHLAIKTHYGSFVEAFSRNQN